MKWLLPVLMILGLGGCASLQGLTNDVTGSAVTANDVYVAANAFDAAVNAGRAYDSLPACAGAQSYACRTSAGVAAVGKAIRTGQALRNQLEAYVQANPGALVPISNYNALLVVISTAQSYVAVSGAGQ